MFDILKNCTEYQNFGLNALTVSALATICFSFFQGYGAFAQSTKIWKEKSGETITILFFVSNFWYFLGFFIFGIYQSSVAITLNGTVGFLYIPILVGLQKFKGFTKMDIIFSLLGFLVIPAMILTPQKNIVLAAMILIVAPFTVIQFFEFLKNRGLGAFSIKYVIIFCSTSAFWLVYSVAILNWPLIVLNGLTTTTYIVVIFLNHKFQKTKKQKRNKKRRTFSHNREFAPPKGLDGGPHC